MTFSPVVVLDACVLYPALLRDLLMHMAVEELIQAKWTEKIHDEWMTAVLRTRPDLDRSRLQRTRELMDLHAGDCLVSDYEGRVAGLDLPDPNDRHVLAAALECGADGVVTWNLKDFPAAVMEGHGVAVWTPDQLISGLTRAPKQRSALLRAMRRHRASLKNPPATAAEYLLTLRGQGLTETVLLLQGRESEL